MTQVSDTLHLIKRGEVWVYFRRVPLDLVQVLDRRFIKKSLGVSDKAAAKKMRALEDVAADALFDEARKQIAGAATAENIQIVPPSTERLLELVRRYVEKRDLKSKTALVDEPIQSKDERLELLEDVGEEIGIFLNPEDPRCAQIVGWAARTIARDAGISEDAIGAQGAELTRRGLLGSGLITSRRRSQR